MCMRMGPLFSVQGDEQLGSWEETLLYHYSLCVTLRSIWTAVRGVIVVLFWPGGEIFDLLVLSVSFSSTVRLLFTTLLRKLNLG